MQKQDNMKGNKTTLNIKHVMQVNLSVHLTKTLPKKTIRKTPQRSQVN